MYRVPGGSIKLSIDNFTTFLEDRKLRFDRTLLLGDFHISLKVNNDASRFLTLFLIEEFCLSQEVQNQSHKSIGLFDRILSYGEIRVNVNSNNFLTQSHRSVSCFSISNWKSISQP